VDEPFGTSLLQQAKVAQALGGFNDRHLNWARAPSTLVLISRTWVSGS
jgi:hypothetical protein